jgi:acyl-CoA thioester hydrolase
MQDYKLQVFSEDVDYSGVVYHANYFKYLERARTTWLNQIGAGLEAQKQQGVYYTISAIDIKYIKPARLDDSLKITGQIHKRRRTQLHFYQEIYNLADNNRLITTANVYVVCVDEDMKPIPIPSSIMETIPDEC